MNKTTKISETEWEVMRVIWAKHPISGSEVIETLRETDATWHPKTARTLLVRLVNKGVLGVKPQGRRHVYSPLISERECVAAASHSFLDRVFGGSLKPMLAFFAEEKRLTRRDLKELEELLENRSVAEGRK